MDIYALLWDLNVVDVLMVIAFASILYLSKKDGIVAGLFKLFGVYCTIFITLHFYVQLSEFLQDKFFGKATDVEVFSFCLLASLIFTIFIIVAKGWDLILKIRSTELLDRWGHITLSIVRGYLICGMLFLGLVLPGNGFPATHARKSFSWFLFRKPAVKLYGATYLLFVERLFPREEMNRKIFKLVEEPLPKHSGEL